jgi:hypothetical protein
VPSRRTQRQPDADLGASCRRAREQQIRDIDADDQEDDPGDDRQNDERVLILLSKARSIRDARRRADEDEGFLQECRHAGADDVRLHRA